MHIYVCMYVCLLFKAAETWVSGMPRMTSRHPLDGAHCSAPRSSKPCPKKGFISKGGSIWLGRMGYLWLVGYDLSCYVIKKNHWPWPLKAMASQKIDPLIVRLSSARNTPWMISAVIFQKCPPVKAQAPLEVVTSNQLAKNWARAPVTSSPAYLCGVEEAGELLCLRSKKGNLYSQYSKTVVKFHEIV